jgi:NitT/TauT family transport system substrate-binding protein
MKKIAILIPALLLAVTAGYLWQAGLRPRGDPPDKITIGTTFSGMDGLLFVVKMQEDDKVHGLEVNLNPYQTGTETISDLVSGRLDLAVCTEFVLTRQILAGRSDLRCLAVFGSGESNLLIGRRDRGIKRPEELRGKTIGVARGTQAEFFLARYLSLHHISLQEAFVVNINPADQAAALAAGKVDAILTWWALGSDMMKKMENSVIAWPAQKGQSFYFLLISRDGVIKEKAAALEKLMQAMFQAANFAKAQPEEARAIIARCIKVSHYDLQGIKYLVKYELYLDQTLLLAMEDEARWMIKNKLTDRTIIPDFLDYFSTGPLLKANPKAVRLVIPRTLSD